MLDLMMPNGSARTVGVAEIELMPPDAMPRHRTLQQASEGQECRDLEKSRDHRPRPGEYLDDDPIDTTLLGDDLLDPP